NYRNQKLLDTVFEVPALEYIVFRHSMAGPFIRLVALAIDQAVIIFGIFSLVIFLSIIMCISMAATGHWGVFAFLMFLVFFILNSLYFVLMEWLNRGRTLGKMALSLRVVSIDGTSLDVVQILIRNLLRAADMAPTWELPLAILSIPTYLVAVTAMFFNGAPFRRLGDLAAGTIVIREQKKTRQQIFVEDSARIRALSAELQIQRFPSAVLTQGLNDFVARRRRLNPARADEIARNVEKDLRRIFGAEQLECDALELILAAHFHLYSMDRDHLARLDQLDLKSELQQKLPGVQL
ncbi:MAG: RDD family protein, partial [Leptospiraceae bacterium]|nr:RDD family protein [Leptospiraceae bacterium]